MTGGLYVTFKVPGLAPLQDCVQIPVSNRL